MVAETSEMEAEVEILELGALETETFTVEAKTSKTDPLEAEILVAARTHERVKKAETLHSV